jgi:hypothetical protein
MKTGVSHNKGLTKGGDVVYPQTLADEAVRAGKLARFYIFPDLLFWRVWGDRSEERIGDRSADPFRA